MESRPCHPNNAYLEKEVFPIIGATPIKELRVSHIKKLLDTLAKRGVHETSEKIRQWIGAIFNYAALLEPADGNPATRHCRAI